VFLESLCCVCTRVRFFFREEIKQVYAVMKVAEKEEVRPAEGHCPICLCDCEAHELYAYSSCLHAYCFQCLQQYYQIKIMELDVISLRCPFPGCTTVVHSDDVEAVLHDDGLEQYEKAKQIQQVKADPNCRYCPSPDCGHPQIWNGGEPQMTCSLCGNAFCAACRTLWHSEETCEQNMLDNAPVDELTLKWKHRHDVRACPNCGIEICKSSGCPKMRCKNCQHLFHWRTGKPMGPQYPNEGFEPEDVRILNLGVTYPKQMYWLIGEYSDEIKDAPNEEKKNEKKMEAVAMGAVITVLLLPIFVVAGPPVGIYRGVKKSRKIVQAKEKGRRRK